MYIYIYIYIYIYSVYNIGTHCINRVCVRACIHTRTHTHTHTHILCNIGTRPSDLSTKV